MLNIDESNCVVNKVDFIEQEVLENSKAITFVNYTGYWRKEGKKPVLSNINLKIKANSLNAIIGTIGCGKSSLFMALLNEIPYFEG